MTATATPAVGRIAVLGVLVPSVVAGLLFAPVLGTRALVVPVLAVVLAVLVVDEVVRVRPSLAPWQPLLAVGAGVVAIVETVLRSTLVAGFLPSVTTFRDFADGALHSARRALESSWPAHADAQHLLFVPLLVLLSATAGVEALRRLAAPLAALVPGVAAIVVSQAFSAATGGAAVAAGLAVVAAGLAVLGVGSRVRSVAPLVAAVLLGGFAAAALDPADRTAYAFDRPAPRAVQTVVTNPLDEIGERLEHPDEVAFVDRTADPVELWTLAVFDRFDGVNWTSAPRLQRLGNALPADPLVTAALRPGQASVQLVGLPSVWLPSQNRTVAVSGGAPLVDPASGVLLGNGIRSYALRWAAPRATASELTSATLAPGGPAELGEIPADVAALARTAAGDVSTPSFRTAIALERFLRTGFRLATGTNLPTGHGYPQLEYFLTTSKRGTSEQFAAAYVVLARQLGIPARLAVGFRQPAPSSQSSNGTYLVRNRDAFAWPEVAVRGLGWVPLDPTGITQSSGAAAVPGALAHATQQVRDDLPQPAADDPAPAAGGPAASSASSTSTWWLAAAVVGLLAVGWLVGVPAAKSARGRRRRRARPTAAAVTGAWLEARDRLRDHGIEADRSMTLRDLARSQVGSLPGDGLHRLGRCVDRALWSQDVVVDEVRVAAWHAVDDIRRSLAKRPRPARVRAALHPRGLVRPRR